MTSSRRHFVGVSETGELMDDPKAFAIEEELMSNKYGLASPDSPAVPYLVRNTWDSPLRRIGWRWVMLSVSIGSDPAWLFRQAFAIWKAARTAIRRGGGPGTFSDRRLGTCAFFAAMAFLFLALVCTGGGPEPKQSSNVETTVHAEYVDSLPQTDDPVPAQPVDGGP